MPTTPNALEWAVGLAKRETTFGTPQAAGSLVDWLAPNSADFAKRVHTFRDDSKDINGFIGATEHQIETAVGELTRKFQGCTEIMTWATALQLGNVVDSGAGDPWTHTMKWPSICTLNQPSFTFNEGLICAGLTATYQQYKGCIIDQQVWTINGKGFLQHDVTIKTDGSETAVAGFTWPTTKNVFTGKLIGSHVTALKCDAALATDLSPILRACKITLASASVVPPNVTSGIFVPEYQFGNDHPLISIEFSVKADKSHALYAAFQAKTVIKFSLTLDPGATPARTISVTCDQGIISSCEQKAVGNETQLDIKLEIEHNATDSGPAIIVFKTGLAAYLVAA